MPTRIPYVMADMRKRPQQARSRATIDAIIEATARILQSRGIDRFTTNAVAEKAGVSIGTLYQYFPNKRALLDALRERHLNDVLSTLQAASSRRLERADRIALFADGMIGAHASLPAAFASVQDALPERQADEAAFQSLYRKAYAVFTALNIRSGAPSDLLGQILASSVTGAIHDAAAENFLDHPSFTEEFMKIITALLG